MVYVVYDNKDDIKRIEESNFKDSPIFHFIESKSKEALKLKSYYAARKNPFVLVEDGYETIAFYAEDKEDPINKLIKYLNG